MSEDKTDDESLAAYKDAITKIQTALDAAVEGFETLNGEKNPATKDLDMGPDSLALELGINMLGKNLKLLCNQFASVSRIPVYFKQKNELKEKKWVNNYEHIAEFEKWKMTGEEKQ